MNTIRLGRSELMVTKTAFGALPIQRISTAEAVKLVRRAYEGGINYFDTANMYTDSEEKLGLALKDVREKVIISTKSAATDKQGAMAPIDDALRHLGYIDLFQFHNPAVLPDISDPNGAFAAALEMKEKGYIRHIGITNHRHHIAKAAIESGNFETLQFPFCYLATDVDLELVELCKQADMGFIAMKGLSGGLLNNAAACHAFMQQYENVVPIWGVQRMEELEQWLSLAETSGAMTEELKAVIEKDRKELAGSFCRGCGYCMPCPAGIEINNSARMNMLLRRAPYRPYLTDEWYEKMHRIENCIHCDSCKSRCPYGLDTPALLQYMLKDYDEFYAQHHND